jgi:hypothetical protein
MWGTGYFILCPATAVSNTVTVKYMKHDQLIEEWKQKFRDAYDKEIEPVLDEQFPKDNVGVEHLRASFSRRSSALVLYAKAYIFAEKFLEKFASAVRKNILKEMK